MKFQRQHYKPRFSFFSLYILFLTFFISSCSMTTGVFEKNIVIPKQQWESGFKPEIDFTIKDTISLYNIYIVLRHTEAYNFNNIWIKAAVQEPGDPAVKSQQYDLTLATNGKGWLGTAMDDIYENRVLIQPETKFKKAGDYHFTLQQIMREDPLKHILNVGIRVEKVK
ncbi:MAG: gliding motility lipoprotein GldH [Bacteroidetes bacterium]|nr:gliding motility lipoprotein GldH [Bacteroidota bacterium]